MMKYEKIGKKEKKTSALEANLEQFEAIDDLVPEGGYLHPEDGLLSISEELMARIPMRNIGGTIYARRADDPVFTPISETDLAEIVREQFSREIADGLSYGFYGSLLKYLNSFSQIKLEDIPINKNKVLFRNGLFDAKKMKFVEIDDHMVLIHETKAKLGRKKKKVEKVKKKAPQTPYFDQFLEKVSGGDEEIQHLILAMIGYLLLPEPDGKVFFVLGTAPNSGKSVLSNFLRRLVGEVNTAAIPLNELGGQFSKSALIGKRLNISMDLDDYPLSPKAVRDIKMLTGDDTMFIDVKHKNPIAHKPAVKFLFGTNAPLKLRRNDPAFWNRVILIPFQHSVAAEEQDKDLANHLWDERDGIVHQAMQEAHSLIMAGYTFPHCAAAEKMKAQWMGVDKTALIDLFLQECCVREEGCGPTTTEELFQAYTDFCREKNQDVCTKSGFSRRLNEICSVEPWSDGKKRGYRGIALREKFDEYQED